MAVAAQRLDDHHAAIGHGEIADALTLLDALPLWNRHHMAEEKQAGATDEDQEITWEHPDGWVTVAVTALPPGWFSVYGDGSGGERTVYPCPALLLQEERRDSDSPDGPPTNVLQPPYNTRVVFAQDVEADGELQAAGKHGSYLGTFGPGQTVDDV